MNPRDFNPAMMQIVRQLHGWSQYDLAERTERTQAFISKLERRALVPPADFVDALAEETDFPTAFFLQSGEASGVPTSVHVMFRKKQTARAAVLDRVNAEMTLRLLHIRATLAHHRDAVDAFSRISEAVGGANSPASAAIAFRAFHDQPSGPIDDLTAMAERSGILVFHCSFGDETDETVDGVSMHVPGLPPTVFLNRSRPADRMRFSLAHEIGHIFLHRIPSETMEQEANAFAAELLLPEKDMIETIPTPATIASFAGLKPVWKVSIACILYRAGELKLLTTLRKQGLWQEMNVRGWRRREPASLDFEIERPSRVAEVFRTFGDTLPEILRTNPKRLEECYGIAA